MARSPTGDARRRWYPAGSDSTLVGGRTAPVTLRTRSRLGSICGPRHHSRVPRRQPGPPIRRGVVRRRHGRGDHAVERRLHLDSSGSGADRSDPQRCIGAVPGSSNRHHGTVRPLGTPAHADDGRWLPPHRSLQRRVDGAFALAKRILPPSGARGCLLVRTAATTDGELRRPLHGLQ